MQYTNRGNIPEFMVQAVLKDSHSMEDAKYSITQLVKPPRALQLERRHKDAIVPEASDFWNVFIGSSVHGGIHEGLKSNDDYIMEQRLFVDVNGVKISGSPDLYQKSTAIIYDHKTMTTAAFGLEVKPEYEQQLNGYAYLLRKNGYKVNGLKLNVIYLDWRKAAIKFADPAKYPLVPCRTIDVPMWSEQEAEQFVLDRLALHEQNETFSDEDLLHCTSKEVWERAGKIAIYPKGGAARAMRLLDTDAEVTDYLAWKKLNRSAVQIVKRPASRQRCEQYCSAAPFCNQYQEWLKTQAGTTPDNGTDEAVTIETKIEAKLQSIGCPPLEQE